MRIERYGIVLERLKPDQIEMVRQWRNDPKIAKFMFYKGEITSSMQVEWFAGIDNEENFFFVIHYKNQPVGLINVSSIDWEEKTAYSGIFVYDEKYWGTDVPVLASLAVLDVFFYLFNLQLIYAKVKDTNQAAHSYNSSLGFVRTKKIEFGKGDEYLLQKEMYAIHTKEIRNAAIRLRGNLTKIVLSKEDKIYPWLKTKLADCKPENIRNLEIRFSEA